MKLKITITIETGHEETLDQFQLDAIKHSIEDSPDFLEEAMSKPFEVTVEAVS